MYLLLFLEGAVDPFFLAGRHGFYGPSFVACCFGGRVAVCGGLQVVLIRETFDIDAVVRPIYSATAIYSPSITDAMIQTRSLAPCLYIVRMHSIQMHTGHIQRRQPIYSHIQSIYSINKYLINNAYETIYIRQEWPYIATYSPYIA